MQVKLMGLTCDIPDDATPEERDRLRKEFVERAVAAIPEEVFNDMCDKVWMDIYGDLPAFRKKELAEAERAKRFSDGRFVVLSEDDIKAIQRTMKADREYEERLKKSKT